MKPMKMILAVVLIIAAAGSAWASVTVTLDPYQRYRVDGWGGVNPSIMVAWADGGEYRQCAEFDISPYKGRTIISAKLEFSAQAIWAGNYVLCVDQIASDLHIDGADFGRASLASVASNQWNNSGYSLDVTSLVASALPSAVADQGNPLWGKGIQFRWSDSGQVNYGNGYTLSNVKLVLELDSVSLDPYQRYRVDGWGGVNPNIMVAWADGGEYRQCAEFDISPYKSSTISSAKLEFSAQAIWAGNYVLCVDQIASDLHIDGADFGRASLVSVASNQWNNSGYSLDVTSLVASALPSSYPNPGEYPWGKGIQFRWSDSGQVNYGNGYTLNNVMLVLNFKPPTLTVGELRASANDTKAEVKNVVVTAAPLPGVFYVAEEGSRIGIRVEYSGQAFSVGDKLDITGKIKTKTYYERYIEALTATKVGTGEVKSVGMDAKHIGGADWKYDSITGAGYRGTVDGIGLNNMGSLVRTWGEIIDSGDKLTFWLMGTDGRLIKCADYSTDPTSYIGSYTFGSVTGVLAVRDVMGGLIDPMIVLRNGTQDFVGIQ